MGLKYICFYPFIIIAFVSSLFLNRIWRCIQNEGMITALLPKFRLTNTP